LSNLDNRGEYKPSLVVTPATVMRQWVREFHEWWPAFRVTIMHASGTAQHDKKEALIAEVANHKRRLLKPKFNA
jgi:SNF2 family DNA or RNA helicase